MKISDARPEKIDKKRGFNGLESEVDDEGGEKDRNIYSKDQTEFRTRKN